MMVIRAATVLSAIMFVRVQATASSLKLYVFGFGHQISGEENQCRPDMGFVQRKGEEGKVYCDVADQYCGVLQHSEDGRRVYHLPKSDSYPDCPNCHTSQESGEIGECTNGWVNQTCIYDESCCHLLQTYEDGAAISGFIRDGDKANVFRCSEGVYMEGQGEQTCDGTSSITASCYIPEGFFKCAGKWYRTVDKYNKTETGAPGDMYQECKGVHTFAIPAIPTAEADLACIEGIVERATTYDGSRPKYGWLGACRRNGISKIELLHGESTPSFFPKEDDSQQARYLAQSSDGSLIFGESAGENGIFICQLGHSEQVEEAVVAVSVFCNTNTPIISYG